MLFDNCTIQLFKPIRETMYNLRRYSTRSSTSNSRVLKSKSVANTNELSINTNAITNGNSDDNSTNSLPIRRSKRIASQTNANKSDDLSSRNRNNNNRNNRKNTRNRTNNNNNKSKSNSSSSSKTSSRRLRNHNNHNNNNNNHRYPTRSTTTSTFTFDVRHGTDSNSSSNTSSSDSSSNSNSRYSDSEYESDIDIPESMRHSRNRNNKNSSNSSNSSSSNSSNSSNRVYPSRRRLRQAARQRGLRLHKLDSDDETDDDLRSKSHSISTESAVSPGQSPASSVESSSSSSSSNLSSLNGNGNGKSSTNSESYIKFANNLKRPMTRSMKRKFEHDNEFDDDENNDNDKSVTRLPFYDRANKRRRVIKLVLKRPSNTSLTDVNVSVNFSNMNQNISNFQNSKNNVSQSDNEQEEEEKQFGRRRSTRNRNTRSTRSSTISNIQRRESMTSTRSSFAYIPEYEPETFDRTLTSYGVPLGSQFDLNNPQKAKLRTSHRRNPFCCMYTFANGWSINIDQPIGRYTTEVKDCLDILKQSLTNARAKATLQTNKNAYLIWIRNPKNRMVASGIFHEHPLTKRVNIEMFATDMAHRKMGLADIMVYLLEYLMHKLPKHDLFVCAALDAVPFWSNPKYEFIKCDPRLLQEHELSDEKTGNVAHLIWYGHNGQHDYKKQEMNLINSFVKFEKLKHRRKERLLK